MHKGVCQACGRTGRTAARPNFYAQETPRTATMVRDLIIDDESSPCSTLPIADRQQHRRCNSGHPLPEMDGVETIVSRLIEKAHEYQMPL
jgi:hypothetical protein